MPSIAPSSASRRRSRRSVHLSATARRPAPLTPASTVGGLDLLTNVGESRVPAQPDAARSSGLRSPGAGTGPVPPGWATQIRTQTKSVTALRSTNPSGWPNWCPRCGRFATWGDRRAPDLRGEFYRHTLMTPTFNPGPNPFGPPPIYVGALGPRLTRHRRGRRRLLVMPFGRRSSRAKHHARRARRAGGVRTGLVRLRDRARDHPVRR